MSTGDYKMLRVLCQPAYKREYPHHNPEPFRRDRMFFVLSILRRGDRSFHHPWWLLLLLWDGGCAQFFFSTFNDDDEVRSLFFIKPSHIVGCSSPATSMRPQPTPPKPSSSSSVLVVIICREASMCRCSSWRLLFTLAFQPIEWKYL